MFKPIPNSFGAPLKIKHMYSAYEVSETFLLHDHQKQHDDGRSNEWDEGDPTAGL